MGFIVKTGEGSQSSELLFPELANDANAVGAESTSYKCQETCMDSVTELGCLTFRILLGLWKVQEEAS